MRAKTQYRYFFNRCSRNGSIHITMLMSFGRRSRPWLLILPLKAYLSLILAVLGQVGEDASDCVSIFA